MTTLLQNNLYLKCDQDNLEPLRSQWDFDKKLIPKALQNIGQLFPHYSRHDHSHSNQILVNIERILGDRLFLLSATDTWLLLESAYWHDIGMVIPRKAFEDAINSKEFQAFRESIANDASSELKTFAEKFNGTDTSAVFSGADSPLDAIDKFRQLMSEWFRRHHPMRSENAVIDPWKEMGISSPRTELIPKRLFSILGRVCALHGATYEEVIAQLPYKEAGLGNDDCHPRYIACLLRLGDLLDMDDNRFCPVMQRIAGDNVPSLTKAHIDKHESIKHFRLDSERIEVHAVCKTIDGYAAQWKWLDWLKAELQKQMSQWQDIVPSKAFGLLPTLGDLRVDISGKQLIAKPGERPEFRLNSPQIMNLLKGENLYKEDDVIRELLQNSVDATLIKIWIENRSANCGSMKTPDALKKNYSVANTIKVNIERTSDIDDLSDSIDWKLTIHDCGIGISKEELELLMSIGSSNRNSQRSELIKEMPEWMRPSGTFGIGFQSVFMWTDVVEIWTKSIFTGECLHITLNSPTGIRKGLVTIEVDEASILRPYGTKLSFNFKSKKKYFNFSRTMGVEDFVTSTYEDYDPLLDNEMPLQTINLIQRIENFNQQSLIEIDWKYSNDAHDLSASENHTVDVNNLVFIPETSCYFHARLSEQSHTHGNNRIYYRGQLVEKSKSRSMHFFDFDIDLLSGKAGEWLNFNRNSIRDNSEEALTELINKNFRLWVSLNKDELLKEKKETLSIISKFKVELEKQEPAETLNFWRSIYNEIPHEWLNLLCEISSSKGAEKTLYKTIVQEAGFIISDADVKFSTLNEDIKKCKLPRVESHLIINEWCKTKSHGIKYVIGEQDHGGNHKSVNIHPQLVSVEPGDTRIQIDTKSLAIALEHECFQSRKIGRLLLPISIFPEFLSISKLELRDDISGWFNYVLDYSPEPEPHVILPFEVKNSIWSSKKLKICLERYEEFLAWIQPKLKNPIAMKELTLIYDGLIHYIDDVVMKDADRWKSARLTKEES